MKSNLVRSDTKVSECIKILKKVNQKTLIVHKKKKLIGTITDSDLRRAYFNKKRLNLPCEKVCNVNPVYILENELKNGEFRTKFSDLIQLIPVLDKNRKIIKILYYNKGFKSKDKIKNTSFIIVAGGEGKRMKDKTKKIPKPLLNYRNKRIMFHIIYDIYYQGFRKIFVSLGYMYNYAKSVIQKEYNKVNFLVEKKKLGTAGFLKNLTYNKISEDFIVINSDIIHNIDYLDLIKFHKKNKNLISICSIQKEFEIPYGVIRKNKNKVYNLDEKPKIFYNINVGVYVFNKKILKIIHQMKAKKIEMNELINFVLKKKKFAIKNYLTHGNIKHFTNPKDLLN